MNRSHANLLSVVFGISGATALIYDIVWSRLLQTIFGSTLYSTSTIFAAFSLGLSIGAFALRNHANTTKQPLVQLTLIEIAIGLYGIFITTIFSAVNAVYLSLPPNNFITLLLFFTILLPQTILFGAIWPFVNSLTIREPGTVGRSSAALYSISSLGSALRAFASGFILVPILGFKTTSALAGIINIGARLLRLILAIRTSSEPTNANQHNLQPQSARPAAPIPGTTASTFFSGMAALIYQVSWIRPITSVLQSTVYVVALILTAFMLGLALGRFTMRYFIDAVDKPLLLYSMVEFGIAAYGLLLLSLFSLLPSILQTVTAIKIPFQY